MYNEYYLLKFSGDEDDEYFEHFVRKFVAICCADKLPKEKWATKLGYYLEGNIKRKYEKILLTTKEFEDVVNDLRVYVYNGTYASRNFTKAQNIKQACRESVHDFANRVQNGVNKGYTFVKSEEEKNSIAVLLFFNGLRKDLKAVMDRKARAVNIEEAELAVLIAMAKNNKENLKCIV